MYLREIGCGLDSSAFGEDAVMGVPEHGNEPSGFIKLG
jgi:hypothetical protein